MNYEGHGNIRVRAYMASGALPVENVLVKIYGADDYNKDVKHSLLTDSNGITKTITLPAPPVEYSTSPGAKESPYAVYNIELAKETYYPKRIYNVPIFSGTTAVLPIEMVPIAYAENGEIMVRDNLNSVIYENENL